MADAHTVFLARQNGTNASNHGSDITVGRVVDLLVDGAMPHRHAAIRRNANRMLEKMADSPWRVVAGSHFGGTGGAGRPPDMTRHVTVEMKKAGYHLRQDSRGHLFMITGPDMEQIHPWIAPGGSRKIPK